MTLDRCELIDNRVSGGGTIRVGGAIYSLGRLIIHSSAFTNNLVNASAGSNQRGAIRLPGGVMEIRSSTFTSNYVDQAEIGMGGAIASFLFADVLIDRCVFVENSAFGNSDAFGGTIAAISGNVHVRRSEIRDSIAQGATGDTRGGAIYSFADTRVEGCTLQGNTAGVGFGESKGGGIHHSTAVDAGYELTVINSTLHGNYAVGGVALCA